MPSNKQLATDRLTRILGLSPIDIDNEQEGTVPAIVFRTAAEAVGLTYVSRVKSAEAVIRLANLPYESNYDSRSTPSEGGGNVTVHGLRALAGALEVLLGVGAGESRAMTDDTLPPPPAGGQDRLLDPVRRQKIEIAAQGWLMWMYERDGWDVVDTHLTEPYDAVATKGQQTLYLEAKGTTTRGRTVIVTRNEVIWARAHPGQCILGVWSGMVFDNDGEVNPDVGTTSIEPWNPDDEDLSPITYDFRVHWKAD